MRACVADVMPRMLLAVHPGNLPTPELAVGLAAVMQQSPPEGAQGKHDAVRVPVGVGLVPRAVPVLEHAHAVILEQDPVEVRVGDRRVVAHNGDPNSPPILRPGPSVGPEEAPDGEEILSLNSVPIT